MSQNRSVYVGRIYCFGGFADHMAVGIQSDHGEMVWYEIQGTGFKQNGPNHLIVSRGEKSRKWAEIKEGKGTTKKTDEEIREFNRDYIRKNGTYNFVTNNCQDYVAEFIHFLNGKPVWTAKKTFFVYLFGSVYYTAYDLFKTQNQVVNDAVNNVPEENPDAVILEII